ncbi:Holliday junction branch migration protein RuvA [Salinibius halmophilus]|uniref:Holliday junction branch migration protein RuvA n=1 Tax=Salinibius halmophilus TaxID=1853216 RepID=UPI000E66EA5D|nr:Holliday junction branch migration protein RuvA [Salinibius halmophilus]
MIGQLTGVLRANRMPELLIDVQGVGYEVLAPMSTIAKLPSLGEQVSLAVHTQVREDAITLFGFSNNRERQLFRVLVKVNGVGPKMALAIMSGLEPDRLAAAVTDKQVTMLTKIPGVGKKTAERLIVELADRLGEWASPDAALELASAPRAQTAEHSADAVQALQALGYSAAQAEKAVNKVATPDATADQLIRDALRSLV